MYIKVAENRLKIQEEEKPGGRQPARTVKAAATTSTAFRVVLKPNKTNFGVYNGLKSEKSAININGSLGLKWKNCEINNVCKDCLHNYLKGQN